MKVLVLNSGSSSIKYCLYEMPQQRAIISGAIEKIAEHNSSHKIKITETSVNKNISLTVADHRQGLGIIFTSLIESGVMREASELFCIGHRVVHGGEYFRRPVLIDDDVIIKIRETAVLAPLHNPANLLGIEESIKQLGKVPQVAVFDTAFHQSLPQHAYLYAVPKTWYEELNIRRYGFHGTSHFYVAKQAARYFEKPLSELNLISLHLGNGASITAIKQGESVDTSMGMTPLEGLMMGSRSGDIDPALAFYAGREKGLSNSQLEDVLNKKSGFNGVCGENDMRSVHKLAEAGDENAKLALQMYVYRIRKYVGAYFAVLGHVDAIIFTGGIGENDHWVREQCCSEMQLFGISINKLKNTNIADDCYDIRETTQPVSVLIIKTDEELEIATQSVECVTEIA